MLCVFNLQCEVWVQGGFYISSHHGCILLKQIIQIIPYKPQVYGDIWEIVSNLSFSVLYSCRLYCTNDPNILTSKILSTGPGTA